MNTLLLIIVIELGMITVVNKLYENAEIPIIETELEITTFDNLLFVNE